MIETGSPLVPCPSPVVINVGDVMFDIALKTQKNLDESQVLSNLGLQSKDFILATIHRAENTDDGERLRSIWDALCRIGSTLGKPVYFPAHPRVRQALGRLNLSASASSNMMLCEPVSYGNMLVLEKNARLIITDSGGVQKEAYFFKTPAIIPRSESEWVELVDAGWATLAGAETEGVVEKALACWHNENRPSWEPYYGDGRAADRIASVLKALT